MAEFGKGRQAFRVNFSEIIGLNGLETIVKEWGLAVNDRAFKLFTKLGFRWHAEAVKRVPVDEGTLKNTLIHNTYWEIGGGGTRGGALITELGTNLEYGDFVEFGTRRIAGGAVLQIGDKEDVSDFEAVHTWPAKERDASRRTSFEILHDEGEFGLMDLRGKIQVGQVRGRLLNRDGELLAARPQEQMPWLRASWHAVKPWFMQELVSIFEPPKG